MALTEKVWLDLNSLQKAVDNRLKSVQHSENGTGEALTRMSGYLVQAEHGQLQGFFDALNVARRLNDNELVSAAAMLYKEHLKSLPSIARTDE